MAADDAALLVQIPRLAESVSTAGKGLLAASFAALVLLAAAARGQESDLTLPPRIDASARSTTLAPPAEGRDDSLEEIIVVGGTEWRLPDLGSEWRARAAAEQETQRIDVSFLPLYDPERDPIDYDPFRINREIQRVGFIELFRVEFGGTRE
jgi:hypothetical protein